MSKTDWEKFFWLDNFLL